MKGYSRRISICMATFNGGPFVAEQIASILTQLGPTDQLVAADDTSSDNTVAIIEGLGDPRIHVLRQATNRGTVATFERALREAKGDILFLSDQDDIWCANKVETILETFERWPQVTMVMSNAELIDVQGRSLGTTLHQQNQPPLGMAANLVKNRFQGCTMAFRRELLEAILPFPDDIPMHDSWIGAVNAIVGKAVYISEPLMQYRRHGQNVTSGKRGPVIRMLAERWRLMRALAFRWRILARARRAIKTRKESKQQDLAVS